MFSRERAACYAAVLSGPPDEREPVKVIADLTVALVALLHVYFLVLEMFLWTTPRGLRTFGNTQAKANDTAVLAANQGLYNGFLAAGLFWGLLYPIPTFALEIKTFFLLCVILAGVYGAYSVSAAYSLRAGAAGRDRAGAPVVRALARAGDIGLTIRLVHASKHHERSRLSVPDEASPLVRRRWAREEYAPSGRQLGR